MEVKVGFSRGRSIFARLICRVTHADVSHTFFHVEDDAGDIWAYESVPGPKGFRRLPYDIYARHNQVKTLVSMKWPHEKVKEMLDGMLGMPYGLLAFSLLAVSLIFHRRPGRTILQNGMDCVKSVNRVTRAFGMTIEAITPSELEGRLKGNP